MLRVFKKHEHLRFGSLVVAAALLVMALTAIGFRLVTPRYSAALVIGPTARMGAAAIGARLPHTGLGGLSAVTEPGLADEHLSDFSRYLQLLRSLPVAERLMATPGVARRLFADRWDAESGTWGPPVGTLAGLRAVVLGLAGRPSWAPPDAVALAGELNRRLIIDTVGTGPMRRVVFRDSDRDFALTVLRLVTTGADAHLREEAERRARTQIDHVRRRLGDTASAEHRRAMADLLAEEERVLMVLEVDLPFAADTIEPVHAAALPDWPNVPMVAAVAGLSVIATGAAVWGWRRPVGARRPEAATDTAT